MNPTGLTAGRGRDGQSRDLRERGSVSQVLANWIQREMRRQQRRQPGGSLQSISSFPGLTGFNWVLLLLASLEPGIPRWQLEPSQAGTSEIASPWSVWYLRASRTSLPTRHLILNHSIL